MTRGFASQWLAEPDRRGRQHQIQVNAIRRDGEGYVAHSIWMAPRWQNGYLRPGNLGEYVDFCVRVGGRVLGLRTSQANGNRLALPADEQHHEQDHPGCAPLRRSFHSAETLTGTGCSGCFSGLESAFPRIH